MHGIIQKKMKAYSALNREVKATRDSLGVLDASTLGKIDIQGEEM